MEIPTPEHQALLESALEYFKSKDYEILRAANLEGYTNPAKQGRHEPDAIMVDSEGVLHFLEAKLGSDMANERTKEQFIDFSRRVMGDGSKHPGHPVILDIVVFRKDTEILLNVLRELSLLDLLGKRINFYTKG